MRRYRGSVSLFPVSTFKLVSGLDYVAVREWWLTAVETTDTNVVELNFAHCRYLG